MQLIAHIPLIAGKLPANAHYFFLNFMGLARLSLESLNSTLDDIESLTADSSLIQDEESYFTGGMHSFGYRSGFMRNMLTILSLATLISLVWLLSALFALIRRKHVGED